MAIDVKELRVGAHVKLDNEQVKIVGLEPYSKNFPCSVEAHRGGLPAVIHLEEIHDLHPIPITEELLTELGFHEVKDTYFSDWHKDWLKITNNTGQAKPYWTYNGFIRLYYLHQLESLYYAMNKTELIKE